MSSAGFNLLHNRWIPFGGHTVSVEEALLEAHHLPGWPDGDPGLAEVVMRLLVPMAYRITRLDDEALTRQQFASHQRRLLDAGPLDPERVRAYLARHHSRFWLLNPPPGAALFAQDETLSRVLPKDASKAVPSWASGNNPALGPHARRDAVTTEVAARQLLTLRSYAWGGLHTKHPDHTGEGKYVGSPLRGTMSVHPLGTTLASTLIGHLVPLPGDGTQFGEPFWEIPPASSPVAAPRGRAGLLEQVAGRQDKTMLLRADRPDGSVTGFTIAEGPGVNSDLFCRDPYLLLNDDGEPRKPRAGRAFWRESEALLAQTGDQGRVRASILDWATSDEGADLYAAEPFSWAAISHLGDKSKDLEWNCSMFPDLLHIFRQDESRRAVAFLGRANDAEGAMVKQIAKVWHKEGLMPVKAADKSAVYQAARSEFWRLAEPDFWDTATSPQAATGADAAWISRLREHALAGYDTATARLLHDRRTHMAVEESRHWIARWGHPRVAASDTSKEND